jgi:hypothetical protein
MTLSHGQSRDRRRQLLDLLFEYDIAFLVSNPDQADEYECLVDPLLGLLQRRATESEIREFLEGKVRTHFGSFDCSRARDSAGKLKDWFDKLQREIGAEQQGFR